MQTDLKKNYVKDREKPHSNNCKTKFWRVIMYLGSAIVIVKKHGGCVVWYDGDSELSRESKQFASDDAFCEWLSSDKVDEGQLFTVSFPAYRENENDNMTYAEARARFKGWLRSVTLTIRWEIFARMMVVRVLK